MDLSASSSREQAFLGLGSIGFATDMVAAMAVCGKVWITLLYNRKFIPIQKMRVGNGVTFLLSILLL